MQKYLFGILLLTGFAIGCKKDKKVDDKKSLTHIPYLPENYDIVVPQYFPRVEIPNDNPLTVDGIRLGQHLFYDPILSADSTMSCASCHFPEKAFTDGLAVSTGIDNIPGTRSSMSIINLTFVHSGLFWDGRAKTLEEQALMPVEDPIELHHDWINIEEELKEHPTYPAMFRKAFGIESTDEITKELAGKAIAQFERIIVTPNSRYDSLQAGLSLYTDLELMGEGLFFDDDPDLPDAECNHCHNSPMMTSDDFFNNGLQPAGDDLQFLDNGKGKITMNIADNGKFRAPTLRNIMLTAPYMHDGSLETIDDVLDHYNSGGHPSPNKDPLIRPLKLSKIQLAALKAFMNTLTDTSYLTNPLITNPYK